MQGLVGRYGGEFHNRPNFLGATVSGLLRGYIGAGEIARIIRANNSSLMAMADDVAAIDLRESVAAVDVPVLFMLGRHDRILDPRFAETLTERVGVPSIDVAWFEHSAHNIPFEEPEAFHRVLRSFTATIGEGAPSTVEDRN
jgi:pimeloyl-ACP methyl ester carboxylesterase